MILVRRTIYIGICPLGMGDIARIQIPYIVPALFQLDMENGEWNLVGQCHHWSSKSTTRKAKFQKCLLSVLFLAVFSTGYEVGGEQGVLPIREYV
jgi:hypothetical protein